MDLLFNIIGIIGVILILLAFYFIQANKVSSKDLVYPVLNLIGSILLMISILWSWNLPSFIIELCWMVISLYGIYTIKFKKEG